MLGVVAATSVALLVGTFDEGADLHRTDSGTGPARDLPNTRNEPLPLPLDPAGAVPRALAQAVAADSNAALILFLARFAGEPEANEARHLLALRRAPDPQGSAEATAGPDAEVVRQFDVARLSGERTDWEAFLAQHGNHPLAGEARLLMAK